MCGKTEQLLIFSRYGCLCMSHEVLAFCCTILPMKLWYCSHTKSKTHNAYVRWYSYSLTSYMDFHVEYVLICNIEICKGDRNPLPLAYGPWMYAYIFNKKCWCHHLKKDLVAKWNCFCSFKTSLLHNDTPTPLYKFPLPKRLDD